MSPDAASSAPSRPFHGQSPRGAVVMPTWMVWVLVGLGALIAGRYVFNFWQLAKLTKRR